MKQEENEQVDKPTGEGADPAPAKSPEVESQPESKPEVEPKQDPKQESVKEEPVDVGKLKEQVDNLNVALKEARNESKGKVDQAKVAELEQKLNEREGFIERLQSAFAPPKQEDENKPAYLTADQAENLVKQKLDEQKQETFKEKQAEKIKTEISELEKTWDGGEGKPKYSDEKVLKWQQDNSKLYLSPVEAFNEMSRKDIVDWEVKQALAGKRSVENVEKPGASPDVHKPAENKPQTDQELRSAIKEAMDSADAEM